METTRPLAEEMDGKKVYFPPESAIQLFFLLLQVLFPICTLTWCVNKNVSRQGKGIYKKNESTREDNKNTGDINR